MALPFIPVFDIRHKKNYKKRILLENLTRNEIRRHCGVSEMYVDELFDLLEPLVEPVSTRNYAVPAESKVLLALSFFRSGSFQYVESTIAGVSQSTTSRIVDKMTTVITRELLPNFIHFSNNIRDLNTSKSRFFDVARFPNVVGLIDGTHITLVSPSENEPSFVNRKNTHSINCQVVSDYDHSFKNIIAKYPGCTHDNYIWRMCQLKSQFQDGLFGNSWLLGDSGYGVEPWLMTPYTTTTTTGQERYNISHKRTRSWVERSIGMWKCRWRSMDLSGGRLCYEENKVCKIIASTAVMHNFCVKRKIPLLEEDEAHEQQLRRRLHDDFVDEPDMDSGVSVRDTIVRGYFS